MELFLDIDRQLLTIPREAIGLIIFLVIKQARSPNILTQKAPEKNT